MHGGLKFEISGISWGHLLQLSFFFFGHYSSKESHETMLHGLMVEVECWKEGFQDRLDGRKDLLCLPRAIYIIVPVVWFPPNVQHNYHMCDFWNFMEAIWSIPHPSPNNNHLPFTWAGRIGEGLRAWSPGWLSGFESPLPFFSYVNLD